MHQSKRLADTARALRNFPSFSAARSNERLRCIGHGVLRALIISRNLAWIINAVRNSVLLFFCTRAGCWGRLPRPEGKPRKGSSARRDPRTLLLISRSDVRNLSSLHGRHLRRVIRVTRRHTVERARFFSEGDLSEHAGQDLPLRLKGFILAPRRVAIVPASLLSDPRVSAIWSAWGDRMSRAKTRGLATEERSEWGFQNWKINTSAIYPFRPRKIVRDVAVRATEISERIPSISAVERKEVSSNLCSVSMAMSERMEYLFFGLNRFHLTDTFQSCRRAGNADDWDINPTGKF